MYWVSRDIPATSRFGLVDIKSPAEASLSDVNASDSALSAISAPRVVLTMFAPSGNRAFCSTDNGLMVSVVEEQLRDKTSLTGSRLPIES